jgi:hypothetical protein
MRDRRQCEQQIHENRGLAAAAVGVHFAERPARDQVFDDLVTAQDRLDVAQQRVDHGRRCCAVGLGVMAWLVRAELVGIEFGVEGLIELVAHRPCSAR